MQSGQATQSWPKLLLMQSMTEYCKDRLPAQSIRKGGTQTKAVFRVGTDRRKGEKLCSLFFIYGFLCMAF